MNLSPVLSIVYSSNYNNKENQLFEEMLQKTSGLDKEKVEILRYKNFNQFSLGAIYNTGLKEAKSNLILFLHHDTIFLEDGWGEILVSKMTNSNYGILGIAGTIELIEKRDQGAWFNSGLNNTFGLVFHPDAIGGVEELRWGEKIDFIIPCVAVDGVFILVNKNRIKADFDEEFRGFHFYDISFCIRNFIRGVEIGVIADHSIKLYHNSIGRITELWKADRDLFLKRYPGDYRAPIIPRFCSSIASDVEFISKKKTQAVHVIILTKNHIELLFDLLDSILNTTKYSNYYVWIGDTGSSERNQNLIRKRVKYLCGLWRERFDFGKIEDSINVERFNFLDIGYYNYSKVNNQIVFYIEKLNYCKAGDLILFCNNDVRLLNNCIDLAVFRYNKLISDGLKIGTVGIKLLFQNNRIQHLGIDAFLSDNNRVYISHRYLGFAHKSDQDEISNVVGNTGAFMMIELENFNSAGGFNELYIDAYQDVELNFKLLIKGFTNVIIENAVAYHYESVTRNVDPEIQEKSKSDWRNLLFPFIIRNPGIIKYFRQEKLEYSKRRNEVYEVDFPKFTVKKRNI